MKKVVFSMIAMMLFPAMGHTDQTMTDEIKAIKSQLNEMKALQERLNALEKKLEEAEKVTTKIQKEDDQLKEDKKTRAISYWKDGFNIETPDKQFKLNFGGVLHFDYRQFEGDRSASGFDIRRGRYDMRGNLYRGDLEHLFRLQIEMADKPYLRNAYWMFKPQPDFSFQLGQFKPPVGGADWLTEEAHVNFVEYSVATPIVPFFDRGIRIQKNFLDDKIQATAGIFNGTGTDYDYGEGDQDNNKEYVGRLMFVPFKDTQVNLLKGLYLAGNFQEGLESINTTRNEGTNRTENYESSYYKWNQSRLGIDKRRYYGGELHWLFGPAAFSYEFNRGEWENVDVFNATSPYALRKSLADDYHSDVHQVWISYFLTGEEKRIEDVFFSWRQPKPKKNFSLKEGTWGAWELMAKYAFHTTSNELFYDDPAIKDNDAILRGSSQAYCITGGIRWIWNPKTRLMLDINHVNSTEGSLSTSSTDLGGPSTRSFDTETAAMFRIILTP